MPENFIVKPLGAVLQQAGLVSADQIEIALREQTQEGNLRLGEILALHGWLKQETADFFAERWPTLVSQRLKQPLGQYLKEAALLDEEQIKTILELQRQTGQQFGALTVLKGWLKQTTINFFLEYLTEAKASYSDPETESISKWQKPRSANPIAQISRWLQRGPLPWDFSVDLVKKRNTGDTILIGLVILLAIAGTLSVGFNIFLKSLEEKIFQQGNELFTKGLYEEAIAKYDELLKRDGNYYQAWTNRGYALAGLEKYDRMLESCSSATLVEPEAIYAWNCQGEALYNLEQYDEALAAFDQAIAINPTDPVFWINRGESLLALKRTSKALVATNEAIALLEQMKQLDESNTIEREYSIALSNQGRVLWEKQRYKEALAAFDQALAYVPEYFPAQRGRGMALKSLRRFEQALTEFERILNRTDLTDAKQAETYFYRGLTLCQVGQYPEAFTAFEEALRLKPDYEAAEQAMSQCNQAEMRSIRE